MRLLTIYNDYNSALRKRYFEINNVKHCEIWKNVISNEMPRQWDVMLCSSEGTGFREAIFPTKHEAMAY
jgi:hypothetical protein